VVYQPTQRPVVKAVTAKVDVEPLSGEQQTLAMIAPILMNSILYTAILFVWLLPTGCAAKSMTLAV